MDETEVTSSKGQALGPTLELLLAIAWIGIVIGAAVSVVVLVVEEAFLWL